MFTHSRAVAALLATCALAVPMAGCGGGGEEGEIEDVVSEFSAAFLDRDGEKVCDLMTEKAIGELGIGGSREDCAKAFEDAPDPTDEEKKQFEDPEVSDVKIDGNTATAKVTTEGDDSDSRTRFVKEGGDWKLDGEE